jgi:hypothetical protein
MPFGAAVAGAAISGAASLAGSAMQSGAVNNASKQGQFNRMLAVQQGQQLYNTGQSDINNAVQQGQGYFQPYYAAGTPAIGQEGALLGLQGQPAADAAMANFQQSPGYQWQLQQGLRAIDAGAAAGVRQPGVRSGATIKAEEAYGQGLAQQDFGNYFTRLNQLAGMGQSAGTSLANLGTWGAAQDVQAGQNLVGTITGQTNQATTQAVGAANAQSSIYGNAAGSLGNTVNSLFSNPNVQNWLGGVTGGGQYYGNNTGFWNSGTVGSPYTPSYSGVASPY